MLNNIKYKSLFSMAFATVALSLSVSSHAFAAKPDVTLRVYSTLNATPDSSTHVFFDKFQTLVKEKYGDRIKFNYFPNGILGKEADAIQQLRSGAIDITLTGVSIWSTIVPVMGVLDQGYLYQNFDEVGKFLDQKPGQYLADRLLKQGNAITLGWGYSLGARNIYTIKPVTKMGDLAGKKIRVLPVTGFINTINKMGAVAIPMPLGEVYSGLQMGVVDGVEHDNSTVLMNKYYEVAKYAYESEHIFNPMVFTINKASFARIPADMQAGVLEAAKEATEYERSQAMIIDAHDKSELQKKGMKFTAVDKSAMKTTMQPLWNAFFSENKDLVFMLDYIKNGSAVTVDKK